MRVLAVDTTTERGSVAVVSGGEVLGEVRLRSGMGHSKRLMPAIAFLLDGLGLPASDIDGYAVTAGPGSFTGLRVGLSCVQGLALASGRPCLGLSTLDVLAARIAGAAPTLVAAMDAYRGEVYACVFESDGRRRREPVTAAPAEAFAGLAPGYRVHRRRGGSATGRRSGPRWRMRGSRRAPPFWPAPSGCWRSRCSRPEAAQHPPSCGPCTCGARARAAADDVRRRSRWRRRRWRIWPRWSRSRPAAIPIPGPNADCATRWRRRRARGRSWCCAGPGRRGTTSRGIRAYCAYQVVADEAHVHNLAVVPEARRQGLARRLLALTLEIAAGKGARAVHLEVRAGNAAARALYRAMGFDEVGKRHGYYSAPVEDAVLLSRTDLGTSNLERPSLKC